jgi:hypothetical protein
MVYLSSFVSSLFVAHPQLLVEKEWLSFGHQMCLRNGISGSCLKTSNEEAPIFLQFLECVRYLLVTYPTAFEVPGASRFITLSLFVICVY